MREEALDAIQTDLAALLLELNHQCLAIRMGLQDTQRTGAIFADHPVATSMDSILFLKDLMENEEDPDLRERASRLYYGCIGQFLRLDLLMMDETLDQFLVTVGVHLNGERLTFGEMLPWIMSQDDFQQREALLAMARPLLAKAGVLKGHIWQETFRILKEDFGYPGYLQFCQEKKGMALDSLAARVEEFLISTDAVYEHHISQWVSRAFHRPFRDMIRYHAIRLLHLTDFDPGFPKEGLLPALRRTLEAMGIEGHLGGRLLVHLGEGKGMSALSRCVALRIPQEIQVIIKPLGGLADYEALFHEMGHALHLAHTDPTLPYPYRHLPRSFALTECFAFLLEGLLREPIWLALHTGLSQSEIRDLSYYKTVKHLCLVRRYAGKFLFEHELFPGGDPGNGQAYSHWLQRATGFVYEPEAALLDLEEEFYSGDYLMGWMGEACLRAYLKDTFGGDWFLKREAGRFLEEIWQEGERRSLWEVLGRIGCESLHLAPLQRTFRGLQIP